MEEATVIALKFGWDFIHREKREKGVPGGRKGMCKRSEVEKNKACMRL